MGQVVVISGLAQGMGRETALILAGKGHSIAGFDMDESGLAGLGEELKRSGGDHLLVPLDITDRPGVAAFRDRSWPNTAGRTRCYPTWASDSSGRSRK